MASLRRTHARLALAAVTALGVSAGGTAAEAIPFARRLSLRAEPAFAHVVAMPEGYPYGAGFVVTGRLNLMLFDPISLQVSALEGVFPSNQAATSNNNFFFGGLRLSPRTVQPEGRLFIDADIGYAATGNNRVLGFSVGAGWEIAVARYLQLGPVVRYTHLIQPDSEPAPEDAHFVSIGLSMAFYPFPPPPPRSGSLVAIGSGRDEDRDYDGVPDDDDRCPDVVEDHDGFDDDDGCPDTDDDRDGIVDSEDVCPRQPETRNDYDDDDGCPDEPPPGAEQFTVERGQIRLRQRVYFPANNVGLPARSMRILGELARFLNAHPELQRIRVVGNADDRGTRREAFSLSLRRAEAINRYLVAQGVEASRLEPVGVGDLLPLEYPHDEVTRARNRRVDFVVTQGSDTPAPELPAETWTPQNRPADFLPSAPR